MKTTAIVIVTLIVWMALPVSGQDDVIRTSEPTVGASSQTAAVGSPQPTVEVAFVLDTTGSMGGLIAGAKAKIWSIANQIVLGKPLPRVRIALVPYRDKGDEYVTKVFDLSDNIDEVYTQLTKFQAGGGGDGPENVNQALHDAVHKVSWSESHDTLKIIYLVGDSPPHNEYEDVPTYDKSAKAGIEKGIYINTIRCGNNEETRRIWQEIAKRAEGTYLAIAQDGGVRDIPTPYDEELATLNRELLETAIVYGRREVRHEQLAMNEIAKSYEMGVAASRSSFAADSGIVASNDLVDDVRNNRVDLDEIDRSLLSEEMQSMPVEELRENVAENQARRDEINQRIKELSAKRTGFVNEELAKHSDGKDGFDSQVVETLKTQAAKKGITYE